MEENRSRVKWDDAEGSNGRAERIAWEALLQVETYNNNVEDIDQGAVTLVVDLAKALEEVQLEVVWAWAAHFGFPQRILRVLCGYFQHQRRVFFEGCVADPLQGSKWPLLLLRIAMQDAMSVLKVYRKWHANLKVSSAKKRQK